MILNVLQATGMKKNEEQKVYSQAFVELLCFYLSYQK